MTTRNPNKGVDSKMAAIRLNLTPETPRSWMTLWRVLLLLTEWVNALDHGKDTFTSTFTTQKLKPRNVPLFRKANWPKFKSLMNDYQHKFMNSHLGRSVEELWNDFTSSLDTFSSQCIPVKTILGKKSLPWITQAIRRQIRKGNRLSKQSKETWDQHRNSIKSKINFLMKLILNICLD